jgi:hypothetical protein
VLLFACVRCRSMAYVTAKWPQGERCGRLWPECPPAARGAASATDARMLPCRQIHSSLWQGGSAEHAVVKTAGLRSSLYVRFQASPRRTSSVPTLCSTRSRASSSRCRAAARFASGTTSSRDTRRSGRRPAMVRNSAGRLSSGRSLRSRGLGRCCAASSASRPGRLRGWRSRRPRREAPSWRM